MTGKSHLITNAASVITYSCGLFALNKSIDSFSTQSDFTSIAVFTDTFMKQYLQYDDLKILIIGVLLSFIGTILPDIDSEDSMISRLLHIHIPIEHRTWLHAIYVPFLFCVIGAKFPLFGYLSFGYFVHLIMDSMSNCGICWFYPISKYRNYGRAKVKKVHYVKLYRTNSVSEGIFVGVFITITVIVDYLLLQNCTL